MSLRYVWAAEQQTAGDIHYGHRRGAQGRTQAIPSPTPLEPSDGGNCDQTETTTR
jgi:hypothetical protein